MRCATNGLPAETRLACHARVVCNHRTVRAVELGNAQSQREAEQDGLHIYVRFVGRFLVRSFGPQSRSYRQVLVAICPWTPNAPSNSGNQWRFSVCGDKDDGSGASQT